MFPDLGRTIGQIFGGQPKKKRQDQPRPFTGVATTAPLNQQRVAQPTRQIQNNFSLNQPGIQKPQQPSQLGQPIQPTASFPGQFVNSPPSNNPRAVALSRQGDAIAKQQPNYLTATANTLGDFAADTARSIPRGFDQLVRSVGEAGGSALAGAQGVKHGTGVLDDKKNPTILGIPGTEGAAELIYGKGPVQSIQSQTHDIGQAAQQSNNPFIKSIAPAAPFIAPLIAGGDAAGLVGTGGIVKNAPKVAMKAINASKNPTVALNNAGDLLKQTLDKIPQSRPANTLQTQVEQAHNAGNTRLAQQLESQLPDQGMNPDTQISPERRSELLASMSKPKTSNNYMDQILKNIGVDTESGLVKGNSLYSNPIIKGYNKLQQGYIEGVDKARDRVSANIQGGLESKNPLTSSAARLPQVAFKNFGQSDLNRQILDTRSSKIQAAGKVAKLVEDDLQRAIKATGNPTATNERIHRVLESPDYLQKVYGSTDKVDIRSLSPKEKVVMDKLIQSNKVRNDINLATGIINKDQHANYANGFHSPRIYDLSTANSPMGSPKMFDTKAGIKRKDISQIDESITSKSLKSPTLASSVRLETALRNKANLEALDELAGANLIRNTAPNKNYVKLDGKKYGKHEGEYIDKQIKSQLDQTDYFNSKIGQQTGDLVNAYQDTKIGSLDRINKKIKTVFAPGTNIGNITSNIVAFSGAANVNPVTMATRMAQAGKQLYAHSKKFNANVYRAEKAGLFAGDTGKQLVGTNDEALKTLTKGSKNPIKKIESFYGNTDKAAALGLFNELKARGLTDTQAVRRAHKATQNYGNAGRGINLLADSPILGKPFARFTPELLRIAKNNVLYNPVGTATKVGGIAAGSAALSQLSGETKEERQARESAVGQTALPGTGVINNLVTGGKNKDNVSLNIPINGSAVNVARASGLNFPIEPGGDPNTALARQLSPVADLTRTTADGKEVVAPNQLVSSLTFKPVADQIANRDFMGRQITDPTNKVRSEIGKGKSQYENADGTRQSPGKDAEIQNRIGHAVQNYLPLANEGNALLSAAQGKEDYYGKKRTLPQAGLRTLGIKTESNDKATREKRVQNKQFFEGQDKQVKGFLTKNPEVADAYFKFNDSSRDRFTNKKSSALVKPEKWSVIKGETTGKVFDQLRQEAFDSNKKDGKPIDPIFQVNDPKRQKELISLRATAPGDDIEKQEILRATTNWFKPFENAESQYFKDSSAYYDKLPKSKKPADQNDRVKAYGEIKYPEQSGLVKGYYQAKSEDPQKGKDYFKANADALSKDFTDYKAAKLENINKKRDILGLDPIKPDTFNNVTFGYEDDEDKVAKDLYYKGSRSGGGSYGSYASRGGRSGGGSRGGSSSTPNLGKSPYAYSVSFKKGSAPKAKISVKKGGPIKIASKSSGKPKVSLKASKV